MDVKKFIELNRFEFNKMFDKNGLVKVKVLAKLMEKYAKIQINDYKDKMK